MKLKDETGRRFGLLVVVRKAEATSYRSVAHWLCKCDCGNETIARADHLRSGNKKSCGCQRGRKMNAR